MGEFPGSRRALIQESKGEGTEIQKQGINLCEVDGESAVYIPGARLMIYSFLFVT